MGETRYYPRARGRMKSPVFWCWVSCASIIAYVAYVVLIVGLVIR